MGNIIGKLGRAIVGAVESISKQAEYTAEDENVYSIAERLQQNNDSRCVGMFRSLYNKHPNNYAVACSYAYSLIVYDDIDYGINILEHASSSVSNNKLANYYLVISYFRKGDYKKAIDMANAMPKNHGLGGKAEQMLQLYKAMSLIQFSRKEKYFAQTAYEACVEYELNGYVMPNEFEQFMYEYTCQNDISTKYR